MLAVGLAALITVRFRAASDLENVVKVAKSLPEGIDLALEQIDYTHNEGGRNIWRLVADRAEHHATEGKVAISKLALTLFDEQGGDKLVLSANEGVVDQAFTRVDVWGEVVIRNQDGYTLTTESLHYQTHEQVASTDAPVRLNGKGLLVDAVGMTLDVEHRRLKLLAKVHTVLEPNLLSKGTL